jgi:hypothetical protein
MSAGHLPQSSSASRFTASASEFFILSQSGERPEPQELFGEGRYGLCYPWAAPPFGTACIRRRDFITLRGGAAAWPRAAGAQQAPMPVVGFLNSGSAAGREQHLAAFRQGLEETGHAEGRNVAIEYRWAEGRYERLPELAAELVRRRVAVIAATGGSVAPLAAKDAITTIPIVCVFDGDPVTFGLVASIRRREFITLLGGAATWPLAGRAQQSA